jgi:DNA replication protein DnaC
MDKEILAQAQRELEEERLNLEEETRRRWDEAKAAVPELALIQRKLAATASSIMAAVLEDADTEEKIMDIRRENENLRERRRQLLATHGFPPDYLEPRYPCPKCKGYGYVGTRMCSCLEKRYAGILTKQLSSILPIQNENFENFRFDYYSSQPDSRLGLSPRQNIEFNFDLCSEYARHFSKNAKNLLLFGASGLGKTYLSTCIAKTVTEQGFSVCYDTVIHVLEQYEREKFSQGGGEEARQNIRRYEKCDLLILDDLGTELTTAYTISAFYALLNGRLMAGRPMIINTNLQPVDFEKRYSPAIASRLNGEFRHLRFLGEDIRQIKKRRGE